MRIEDLTGRDVLHVVEQVARWLRANPDAAVRSIEIENDPTGPARALIVGLDHTPEPMAWRAVRREPRALSFRCDAGGRVTVERWEPCIRMTEAFVREADPRVFRARIHPDGTGKVLFRLTEQWALYRVIGWAPTEDRSLDAELVWHGTHDRGIRTGRGWRSGVRRAATGSRAEM